MNLLPFILIGQIGQLNAPARVLLTYESHGKEIHDTATIQDGTFTFKGDIDDVCNALLILEHAEPGDPGRIDAIFCYIESGEMELQGKDSLVTATFTKGAVNMDYQQLQALIKPIRDRNKVLLHEHAPSTEFNILRVEEKQVYQEYAAAHPSSVISVEALSWMGPPDHVTDSIYRTLTPAVKSTVIGKAYAKRLLYLKP